MNLIYKGPSMIDQQPIIALATCLDTPSRNTKTGPMAQVYILREDVSPVEAVKSGQDYSVCGDCVHRAGSCYVVTAQAPSNLYRAYRKGRFTESHVGTLPELGRGKTIRLGAYGDPNAIPIGVWSSLLKHARGWTGYTHSPHVQPELKKYCQASTETVQQTLELQAQGWKTYRTKTEGAPLEKGEVYCPSNSGVQCYDCKLCSGTKKNVAIDVHGTKHKIALFQRLTESSHG